jgi:hypothetical protein
MSELKCKFYKKQFLSKYCELFKTPCYGTACNFHKEFIKLAQLEQQLQTAKEEIIRLQSNDYFYVELDKKNELLTRQNKQLMELISEINEEYSDDGILSKATKYAIEQAFNQLRGGE